MNKKEVIRLTESQFQQIVKGAVKNVLKETKVAKGKNPDGKVSSELLSLCDRIESRTGFRCTYREIHTNGTTRTIGEGGTIFIDTQRDYVADLEVFKKLILAYKMIKYFITQWIPQWDNISETYYRFINRGIVVYLPNVPRFADDSESWRFSSSEHHTKRTPLSSLGKGDINNTPFEGYYNSDSNDEYGTKVLR